MNIDDILNELKSLSSERYKKNVLKMGIPEDNSIGVSTADIRKLAKELGKSQELAQELWNIGYHEAKILSILLIDDKKTSLSDVRKLMLDVKSWDLCDHICKNLIIKLPNFQTLIDEWCSHPQTYFKRAAFSLMTTNLIHNKDITDDTIDCYLQYIEIYSEDNRIHVRKAISWALREIGKMDFDNLEKAITVAYEMKESENKDKAWIGKDAIKELETLVQVQQRRRLLTFESKMGRLNARK